MNSELLKQKMKELEEKRQKALTRHDDFKLRYEQKLAEARAIDSPSQQETRIAEVEREWQEHLDTHNFLMDSYDQQAERYGAYAAPEPAPQTPSYIDFNLVEPCRELCRGYLDRHKAYYAEREEIERTYRDAALSEKLAAHKATAPDEEAALTKLSELIGTYRAHLDSLEARSTDNVNTKDLELLKLSGRLTVKELQAIHARNADSPIVCRELRAYYDANVDELPVNFQEVIDFSDSISTRRGAIAFLESDLTKIITTVDHEGWFMRDHAASQHFPQMEAVLSGEGRYTQPQVLAPGAENGGAT